MISMINITVNDLCFEYFSFCFKYLMNMVHIYVIVEYTRYNVNDLNYIFMG